LFWAVSLLTYYLIILCLIIQVISLPFRVCILTDKIFMIPQFVQNKTKLPCLRLISVPAKIYLLKFPTIIGFAENQLSKSVLSFTTPTTVLRMLLLQQPVRTFIILTMVKSPGFGSNFRHSGVILTSGLSTYFLASNVNLVTHYAKGTFFSLRFELLIKLLFIFVPSWYSTTIAYILYLVFEEGSPIQTVYQPFYFLDLSTFTHVICRISFDLYS